MGAVVKNTFLPIVALLNIYTWVRAGVPGGGRSQVVLSAPDKVGVCVVKFKETTGDI